MASIHNHLALVAALLPLTWLQIAAAESSEYIRRDFLVDVAMLSYVPGEGIEGYESHSSGMADVGSKVGLGFRINGVFVSAEIAPRIEERKFLVAVDLEPEEAKRTLGFEKQTLDLTDLKPTAIRLATNEDGRVYQLNLTPSIRVTDNTPRRLDVSDLGLHNWRFPNSPILVNDALYVGRLSSAASPVAFVDISGVARVEFSLYQLTESKPWGVLDRGIITLTHPDEQTKIQISNVRNGSPHEIELPAGPYRVWVRWSPPSRTLAQHRQKLVELRKKILSGEVPNADTAYLDKQLAREPSPWLYYGGVRGLKRDERVDDAD